MTQAVTQPGVDKPEMYLRQRNGIWYFRRRVPSDLEGIIEPGRFHYSLGTRSRQEAVTAYSAALAQSESEIANAREKLGATVQREQDKARPSWHSRRKFLPKKAQRTRTRAFCQYAEKDILHLVARWFERGKSETEMTYRDFRITIETEEERQEQLEDLYQQQTHLIGKPPEIMDMILSREVRSILDAEDCEPPRGWLNDPLFRRFYGLVAEGLLNLNRIAISLLEKGEMPERFQGIPAFVPTASFGAPSPVAYPKNSITLDELITRFAADPKRMLLRENTRKEYQYIYRLLREQLGGEKPIVEITRDDVRTISDVLLHIPGRSTLPRKGQKKGELLRDIAARAKAEGKPQAQPATYNKKIEQIATIFNWAETEQLISSSPARSLSLPKPPSNGEEKTYTSKQLQIIFSGELFTQFFAEGAPNQFVPNHPLKPCLFWVPLFALFHGARSGEILKLQTSNIFDRDGVAVFRMQGRIKNQPSWRAPQKLIHEL